MYSRVIFVLFIWISSCYAAPASKDDTEAEILLYENENDGHGNYHYRYLTSNGIERDETGTLVNSGQPNAYIQVKGIVTYINTDGEEISVKYTADDRGYHVLPSDAPVPGLELGFPVSPLVVASLLGGG